LAHHAVCNQNPDGHNRTKNCNEGTQLLRGRSGRIRSRAIAFRGVSTRLNSRWYGTFSNFEPGAAFDTKSSSVDHTEPTLWTKTHL
jgi:hypothetical protein